MGLISLAVIGLELTLMRVLSLRYWHHFAYMIISVALLGFGASGTLISLLRQRILKHERTWLYASATLFSLSIPLTISASRHVPLNVRFLAWDFLGQAANVLAVELLMLIPFFLAGLFVGVTLMDRPERVSGHYAANLIGSGAGAVLSVTLMHVLTTHTLLVAMAVTAYAGALVLVPWKRRRAALWASALAAALVVAVWRMPSEPALSQYKMLSLVRNMPSVQEIHHAEGPLGRIDVVAAPSIHYAPGLSLRHEEPLPPHVLLIVDGDQTSAVYDCRRPEDWAFLDKTTAAAAYWLSRGQKVLVIGAGGGADIGLAVYHKRRRIVALEMNSQIIETMTGPLAARAGEVYAHPSVEVLNREARGYLAAASERFDIIQLPAVDAYGASGAGLYAAQESYLYTVESFSKMLDRLSDDGVLCVTRWARTPPRDGLRILDTAAVALRRLGATPSRHLAMIRSWATVTVLVSKRPISARQSNALRVFCKERGFDLCSLPGLDESEANTFHLLDRPYYFEAATALLGSGREGYLKNYLFEIEAPTDDRPYFHCFFRWQALPVLRDQLGGAMPAFLELGYILLIAALGQGMLLGVVLILLPLAPGVKAIRFAKGKALALGYFLLLGIGFMLLEMSFLQKLVLYLADPIYSAAVVIGGFLIFGGIGSWLSGRWRLPFKRLGLIAAGAVVCLASVYLFFLDVWLGLSQAQPVVIRFVIAAVTIAPLALAMGHMFPLGLRQVGKTAPALVPWAWAVNGCASVVATVAAPLIAMHFGFSRLTLAAVCCYGLAGVLSRFFAEEKSGSVMQPRSSSPSVPRAHQT